MKRILILISMLLGCFGLLAKTLPDDRSSLEIFGIPTTVPDGYHHISSSSGSKLIYSLVNSNLEIDGEYTVGYVAYGLLESCEFCDFYEPHKSLNIVSICEAGDYVAAEMKTTEFYEVSLFIVKSRQYALTVGGDKTLFRFWLSQLGMDDCKAW